MKTMKELLDTECDYRMRDETKERFIGMMTEMRLKNREPLIPYGKMDNNIYAIKSGVIRATYFDGLAEKTFGFASEGGIVMSNHCFYKGLPSVFQYEACGEAVLMKVSKKDINELLHESKDFMAWMLAVHQDHLFHWEMKAVVIAGTAKERFENLIKRRPEIIENVTMRAIASYIGVTPQYLCTLKDKSFADLKKQS